MTKSSIRPTTRNISIPDAMAALRRAEAALAPTVDYEMAPLANEKGDMHKKAAQKAKTEAEAEAQNPAPDSPSHIEEIEDREPGESWADLADREMPDFDDGGVGGDESEEVKEAEEEPEVEKSPWAKHIGALLAAKHQEIREAILKDGAIRCHSPFNGKPILPMLAKGGMRGPEQWIVGNFTTDPDDVRRAIFGNAVPIPVDVSHLLSLFVDDLPEEQLQWGPMPSSEVERLYLLVAEQLSRCTDLKAAPPECGSRADRIATIKELTAPGKDGRSTPVTFKMFKKVIANILEKDPLRLPRIEGVPRDASPPYDYDELRRVVTTMEVMGLSLRHNVVSSPEKLEMLVKCLQPYRGDALETLRSYETLAAAEASAVAKDFVDMRAVVQKALKNPKAALKSLAPLRNLAKRSSIPIGSIVAEAEWLRTQDKLPCRLPACKAVAALGPQAIKDLIEIKPNREVVGRHSHLLAQVVLAPNEPAFAAAIRAVGAAAAEDNDLAKLMVAAATLVEPQLRMVRTVDGDKDALQLYTQCLVIYPKGAAYAMGKATGDEARRKHRAELDGIARVAGVPDEMRGLFSASPFARELPAWDKTLSARLHDIIDDPEAHSVDTLRADLDYWIALKAYFVFSCRTVMRLREYESAIMNSLSSLIPPEKCEALRSYAPWPAPIQSIDPGFVLGSDVGEAVARALRVETAALVRRGVRAQSGALALLRAETRGFETEAKRKAARRAAVGAVAAVLAENNENSFAHVNADVAGKAPEEARRLYGEWSPTAEQMWRRIRDLVAAADLRDLYAKANDEARKATLSHFSVRETEDQPHKEGREQFEWDQFTRLLAEYAMTGDIMASREA